MDYNVGMGVNQTAIILKKIFRGAKNILINQLCWHGIWSELAFWKWRERIFSYDTIPSNDRNQFWQSFLWGAINSYQKNAVTKCKKKNQQQHRHNAKQTYGEWSCACNSNFFKNHELILAYDCYGQLTLVFYIAFTIIFFLPDLVWEHSIREMTTWKSRNEIMLKCSYLYTCYKQWWLF